MAEPWEAQALRRGRDELPATWPGLSGQRAPLACAKPSLAPQILAAVVTTREVEAGLQGYYKFEFSLGHGGRPCVQRVCVPQHLLYLPTQQSKMEDRLDEAIHVLRSHAVGTASDLHGLLPGHGALTTSFAGPMPLGGRHAGLVSGGHPEEGLNSGASLLHNHASLPSQPSSLPDLSQRPPDSFSGKSQRSGLDHRGKDRITVPRGWKCGSARLKHLVADLNWTHSGVSLGLLGCSLASNLQLASLRFLRACASKLKAMVLGTLFS